jgi:hypothetical protein
LSGKPGPEQKKQNIPVLALSKRRMKMAKTAKKTEFKKITIPMPLKAVFAGGAMIAGAALFGGCGNPANNKVCECPEGTTHQPGEKCCDGENCQCQELLTYDVYLDTKKIHVEDPTGLSVKAYIQTALDDIIALVGDSTAVIHFKGMNSNPIMVIENTHNFRVDGNKFFVGIDEINNSALDAMLYAIAGIYNGGEGLQLMTRANPDEIIKLGKSIHFASAPVNAGMAQRCQAPFLEAVLRRETTWM